MKKIVQKKPAKKITEQRLQNIALGYLQQFGGTEKAVRNILHRRIQKSLHTHPNQDQTLLTEWTEKVIERLKSYGYINDVQYAKNRIKNLLNKGKSTTFIKSDLYTKGISTDIINNSLTAYTPRDINRHSAYIFVQKHRLGVHKFYHAEDIAEYLEQYDNYHSPHYHQHKKDLAKCARQGFGYTDSLNALLEV